MNKSYLDFLIAAEHHRTSPALCKPAAAAEGALLFEGFEFPDDTNLAEAGWTLTGDFLPDRNPSTAGGEGAIGRKRLNTWEGGPLGDDNQGTLSQPAFEITDNYLNFLLGGGGRSDGSLQAEASWSTVRSSRPRPARTTASSTGRTGTSVPTEAKKRCSESRTRPLAGGTLNLRPPGARGLPPRCLAVLRPPSTWLSTDRSSAPPPAPTAKPWTGSAGISATCKVKGLESRSSTTTPVVGDMCWPISSPSRTLRPGQPPNGPIGWTTAGTSTPV